MNFSHYKHGKTYRPVSSLPITYSGKSGDDGRGNNNWRHLSTKLSTGEPGNEYEQEADQVAEHVMRMPAENMDEDKPIQKKHSSTPRIQRLCTDCDDELEEQQTPSIQTKPASSVSTSSPSNSVNNALNSSGGSPLHDSVRSRVEPVLNTDLSHVRVHSGSTAQNAAQSINARAFTHQHNIYLGSGQSATDTKLMAHEATHVVQQKGNTASSRDRIQRNNLSEADLPSPTERGISTSESERRTFMREVYRRQVAIWTSRGATYVHEITAADLTALPSSYVMTGRSVKVHTTIAPDVQSMLDDARSDLASAGGAAADIEAVAVRSGYRSATSQFGIWQRFATRQYYNETRAHRRTLSGGEHGPAAAQHLAEYTNQRVFSPGYSPHQRATAVDLTYKYRSGQEPAGTDAGWAPASSQPAWINTWRHSWFFRWLWHNAPRYGFMPNPNINEPWHWEYRPSLSLVLRAIRWILDFLDRLLGTGWSAWFEERYSADRGPLGGEEEAPEESPGE